jgi:hypothetical protein
MYCVLPPHSSVIERNILKQWIKDKSLYCFVRENRWKLQAKRRSRDCAGNCFAYDNDKPWLAVHKEKLGHALSLNMIRCDVIHDGEIFLNHGVLIMLASLTWLGLTWFANFKFNGCFSNLRTGRAGPVLVLPTCPIHLRSHCSAECRALLYLSVQL